MFSFMKEKLCFECLYRETRRVSRKIKNTSEKFRGNQREGISINYGGLRFTNTIKLYFLSNDFLL